MRSHARQGLLWSAGILLIGGQVVLAQSVPGPFPIEQTVDGVTLQITKAGFYRGMERRTLGGFGGGDDQKMGFTIAYKVSTPTINAPEPQGRVPPPAPPLALPSTLPPEKLMPRISDVRLFSPLGEPLYQSYQSRSSDGGFDKWFDVAPYWDHVKARFEWLDPAAPPGATGQFEEIVEFKNVPLPENFHKPREVNQTLTTKHGTPIILEQVVAKTEEDQQGGVLGKIEVIVSWAPSEQVPDMMAELSLQGATDSTGREYPSAGSSSRRVARYTLSLRDLPPQTVKTINLSIKVNEEAPSLKQPQWFRHAIFDLKLPNMAQQASTQIAPVGTLPQGAQTGALTDVLVAPRADMRPVIAQAEGLTAELEGDSANDWQFKARLWLRDQQPLPKDLAPDPLREWFVKKIAGRAARGQEYRAQWEPMTAAPIYFKADNRPALPHERSQPFVLDFQDQQKPPKLSLEVEVEAVRHQHTVFDFVQVPVPKPGETHAPNVEVTAANGARIILRHVCYFTSTNQLPGVADTLRNWRQMLPGNGLALVFEAVPALGQGDQGEQGGQDMKHYLKATQAYDEQGRRLHRHEYATHSKGNVLVHDPPQPHWWTVYLLPPAAEATSFNIQVVTDEVLPTGQTRTLTFPDVPLPDGPQIIQPWGL